MRAGPPHKTSCIFESFPIQFKDSFEIGIQCRINMAFAVPFGYARKAQVVIPTLEDYERKLAAAENVIVPMTAVA
jgi:hypothetical protein